MRNLLTRVPKSAQSFVATMVRTIFAQPGRGHRARAAPPDRRAASGALPGSGERCSRGRRRSARLHRLPEGALAQLWSNNSLERLNKEIRRRTDVVGIFPDRASIIRLVGALLAEPKNDDHGLSPPAAT
jgi:transposase-like protein